MTREKTHIEGERFDAPFVIRGSVEAEPERYIAEKPYELTLYEFTVLRRASGSKKVASTSLGATIGVVITIAGKLVLSLTGGTAPEIEMWQIYSAAIGVVIWGIASLFKSADEKQKAELENVIDGHFTANRPRRVHVTSLGSEK